MDALVMVLMSSVVPFLLEKGKTKWWFPFTQKVAPVLNRVTPLIIAFVTAVGISVSFDPSTGVLSVMGLVPDQIMRAAFLAIVGFVTNQASYHGFVKPITAPKD